MPYSPHHISILPDLNAAEHYNDKIAKNSRRVQDGRKKTDLEETLQHFRIQPTQTWTDTVHIITKNS